MINAVIFALAAASGSGSGAAYQGPIQVEIPKTCPIPQVVDLSLGEPWTDAQVESINEAIKHGCRDHFADKPCVAHFIRTPGGTISVLCDSETPSTEASAPGTGSGSGS